MTSSDCSSCDVGRAFRLGFAPSRVRSISLFRKKRDRLAPSRRSHNKKCGRDGACFSSTEKDATFRSRSFSRLRALQRKWKEIFLPTRALNTCGPSTLPVSDSNQSRGKSKSARTPQCARLRPSRALRRADPRVTRTRSRRAVRRASERAERARAVARDRNARHVAWRAPAGRPRPG